MSLLPGDGIGVWRRTYDIRRVEEVPVQSSQKHMVLSVRLVINPTQPTTDAWFNLRLKLSGFMIEADYPVSIIPRGP